MPYIFVYTKATGTGDLGGYYKSRITYEMATNTTAGFSEFYALTDPNVEYGVTGGTVYRHRRCCKSASPWYGWR